MFTLVVQTEKEGRQIPIRYVALYVPAGFSIDSLAPTPGWEGDWSVQSDPGHPPIKFATWVRDEEDLRNRDERNEASEQDAVFQFLGRAASSKRYGFTVRHVYTDGTLVQWGPQPMRTGAPKASAGSGPKVVTKESLGGDGNSSLSIAAMIVGALDLAAALAALLLQRRSRPA